MSLKFLTMLFILYGIQGIPYGIQSRFLPVYLRSQNFSLTVLGLIKLLYIPWILKTFYAPAIDKMWSKIKWLKLSVFLLCITSTFLSLISFETSITLFTGLFFLNLFSATQDIALDGLMIAELSDTELGVGNIAQVVGYKLGAVVGGGLLLFLSFYISWMYLFLLVSVIYLSAFFSLFFLKHVVSNKSSKPKEFIEVISYDYLQIIKECVKVRGTMTLTAFVLIYKLAEQGALTLFPLFLFDSGSNLRMIGLFTGIVGQLSSVLGSSVAVMISKNKGLYGCLYNLSLISILIHIVLIFIVYSSGRNSFVYFGLSAAMMNVLLFVSGIRTTATFSLMMKCSQSAPAFIQATHYTFLATMEVLGKLVFSSIIGVLADYFGYCCCYYFFLAVSVVIVYFLQVNQRTLMAIESSLSISIVKD